MTSAPAPLIEPPRLRTDEDRRWLVALNLGQAEGRLAVPGGAGRVELSTVPGRDGETVGRELILRPDEGLLVELVSD